MSGKKRFHDRTNPRVELRRRVVIQIKALHDMAPLAGQMTQSPPIAVHVGGC